MIWDPEEPVPLFWACSALQILILSKNVCQSVEEFKNAEHTSQQTSQDLVVSPYIVNRFPDGKLWERIYIDFSQGKHSAGSI